MSMRPTLGTEDSLTPGTTYSGANVKVAQTEPMKQHLSFPIHGSPLLAYLSRLP